MGWQRYDAGAGPIRISEEVAVRIESISRTVKTVCRLNSVENLLLVVVNYTLNRRAGTPPLKTESQVKSTIGLVNCTSPCGSRYQALRGVKSSLPGPIFVFL